MQLVYCSFSVQQCKQVQCECQHAEWYRVNVGFIFPWCTSLHGWDALASWWCNVFENGVSSPTASGLPVQLNKSVRMFSGCRSETLKECGICLHDCVCVCKKDCYRVWMLRVCWRKLAVREPSGRDWGVRCEICVMFDVPDICYCMCCTPNYSWVSVGLFISIK